MFRSFVIFKLSFIQVFLIMKAQCPNCKVLYKIDDAKIPEKGAFVTCSKCQTRFEVKNPAPLKASEPIKQALITCPSCSHVNLTLDKCAQCGYIFSEEEKQKLVIKI
jgi:predicted Zn finger-like uncharacterized protein